MDYKTYREIIARMSKKEREIATLLYIKDIKDLLMSLLESQNIEPKHY